MKKLIRTSLFLLPALLLTGCNYTYVYNISGLEGGGQDDDVEEVDDAGTYDIKIWVDEKIVPLTQTQIATFIANNAGKYTINLNIAPVSESNAASSMMQDVQQGADIFCFAQDQLARLKMTGALAKLPSVYADTIANEMPKEAIDAASVNEEVYAFPITSDNGYFLYYDKSVVSEDAAKNMTTLIKACSDKGKKLYFGARGDGFYAASYFMATGCYSKWSLNAETGKFDDVDDNYNSDGGKIAATGIKELDSDAVIARAEASQFGGKGKAGAMISGIWDYEAVEKRIGENLACAELPSYTVDGKDYHLSSFDGYKLLGVKPQVDPKKASVCRKIARFLVSEECQTERFTIASWGPTNIQSNKDPEIEKHQGLAALKAQHEYAQPQTQCPGEWFSTLAATAKDIKSSSSASDIANLLTRYDGSLQDILVSQD